jgi:large repetitive protein
MNVHAKESRRTHLGVEPLEARDVPSAWSFWARPQANSQVSGMVYADQNADGHAQNWERRLQGILVVLTGTDAAGPPGNQIRRQTFTDQGGIYWFKDLPAGGYSIRITPPDGFRPGGHDVGAFGGTPNGATIELLTIPAGQSSGAYNFGLTNGIPIQPPVCPPPPPPPVCPPPAANSAVSGLVYVDENADGRAQDWEWRLEGVTVTLSGADTSGAAVTRTTTTDHGGIYYFNTLPAGTYAIQVTTPAGYTPGQSSVGAFGGNPQPNLITSIAIPAGQSSGAYNFGELKPTPPVCPPPPPPAQGTTIGGLVFLDADFSGSLTADDTPIPGVSVSITGTTTGGQSVNLSTTTGPDGTYSFANLVAGTYAISVVQPDGLLQGPSTAGAFGGTPAGTVINAIPVPAGQTSLGYDFGFIQRLR